MNEQTQLGSILSEQMVLGSIILDNERMDEAIELLQADDFYLHSHRVVYQAMLDLYEQKEPIELGSIFMTLNANGNMGKTPGWAWLATLIDGLARTDSIGYYAKEIKKKSLVRDMARAASAILEKCFDDPDSPTLVEECQKTFWDACDAHLPSGLVTLGDAAMKYLENLQSLHESGQMLSGLLTGFRDLDFMLLGLQKSDLIILAARPSIGKTSLSFHIAVNAARKGHPVAYFSIEMADVRIGEKAISLNMPVDTSTLRSGRLGTEAWADLANTVKDIDRIPFRLCDDARLSPVELKAKAQRMKREIGLELIVVDYLQLMRGDSRMGKFERVGENVKDLKAIAKELDVPVLCLSQLNRDIETRGAGAEPIMSDLGESGEIERTADVIIFLYEEAEATANTIPVKVGKNRTGATGNLRLHYEKRFNRFGNHYTER